MGRLTKKHLAGFFFIGATAGAAIGLLYAPKAGTQTRKDIRKFSKRAVDRFDDLQDDIRGLRVLDNVKEYVGQGKNKLRKMIQTA